MKLSHLQQITSYLQNFQKISAIYRVSDTIIKIAFDKESELYFDMRRSNSSIFRCDSYKRTKIYNAPFDIVLAKRFNRSNVESVELLNGDKIIRFKCSLASAYKEEITYLQLEFTGKYTNAILLDENNIVLEALRHIDLFSSFREVRVGQKLLDVKPAPFTAKEYPLENVEAFLYETYEKEQALKLNALKKQKIALLQKKVSKLAKLLEKLDDEATLQQEAQTYQHHGNLVLSNMHTIKSYSQKIEVYDYDATIVEIAFEKAFSTPSQMSTHLFNKSKKAKQRASNLHIERESLSSKIEHLKLFINSVQEAKTLENISLLFPKQLQTKKKKTNDSIETFLIEGYKVQLGKNERGNIELLQSARAKDIWLHLKERPSTHVIITTDKQNVPQSVIESAAKLCVSFTTTAKDKFLVDYTPRREVNIQQGANVLYNKYKTIEVDLRS